MNPYRDGRVLGICVQQPLWMLQIVQFPFASSAAVQPWMFHCVHTRPASGASSSLFPDPLHPAIKNQNKNMQDVLSCLQTLDPAHRFHINASHIGFSSFSFPSGVLCRTPELAYCQEVCVPAETPFHLPAALQVDSDILFSHWQIAVERYGKIFCCSLHICT